MQLTNQMPDAELIRRHKSEKKKKNKNQTNKNPKQTNKQMKKPHWASAYKGGGNLPGAQESDQFFRRTSGFSYWLRSIELLDSLSLRYLMGKNTNRM